jgi:hydroxymethylbilane synthase
LKSLTIRVGTRGSPLALAQTEQTLERLRALHPRIKFVAVPIKTTGDRLSTATKLRNAGKGLFVKEIERALLTKKVSMAIHSMKDLPSELPEGLTLGAIPERADPSDVFISRTAVTLDKLPPGARIGTSSLRRQAILRSIFRNLVFEDMKGNLDTRLEKLRSPRGPLSGIVVAAAGLGRLYPDRSFPVQALSRETLVPAAGQGALALEIREDDARMRELLAPMHHPATAACILAERELQRRLEGGCQVPLGAYAEVSADGLLTLRACLASLDGLRVLREKQTGLADDPVGVAEALETALAAQGAREILDAVRPKKKPLPRS